MIDQKLTAVVALFGLFAVSLTACQHPQVRERHPANDSTESALTSAIRNSRDYVLSKRIDGRYWAEPLVTDASVDALVLAVAKRFGKLTPELLKESLETIEARMTSDRSGWNSYFNGPLNPDVTAIVLLCLEYAGVEKFDQRFAKARELFDRRGGRAAVSTYPASMLFLLDLVPDELVPPMTPRMLGSSHFSPMSIDRLGVFSAFAVPLIGIAYLKDRPAGFLSDHRAPPSEWLARKSYVGRIAAAPGKKESRLFKEAVKNVRGSRWKIIEAGNAVVDKLIAGSKSYWIEQGLIQVLQTQNKSGRWYTVTFTLASMRFLEEAQRAGLGDFGSQIDQAWKGLQSWRIRSGDGSKVQQLLGTGTWDTSSAVGSLSFLQGTPFEVPKEEFKAATDWMVEHSIPERASAHDATRAWNFDESDIFFPDVDTTAHVMESIADGPYRDDPVNRQAVREGLRWVLALQNKDGGFPAWKKGVSRTLLKIVSGLLHMPAFADLSQADITGRVLMALHAVEPVVDGTDLARLKTARTAACQYLGEKLPKVQGIPVNLASGHWLSNYQYSAASTLAGLVAGNCYQGVQDLLAGWLIDVQNSADGGWGESNAGYNTHTFVPAPSTLSQTALALFGLIAYYESYKSAGHDPDDAIGLAIERGTRYLIKKSDHGTHFFEKEFTGVFVEGTLFGRYEFMPAYMTLYVLARWARLNGEFPPAANERAEPGIVPPLRIRE